jgi:serine recombinase
MKRPGKAKATPPDDGTRLVGYARVSTDDQDLSAQIDALTRRGVLDDNMHTDKASGAGNRRPGLSLAFKDLRPGDTLIVWKLDRLGRDLIDLLTRLKWLRDNNIGFESLTEAIDGATPQGRFTAAILGANAQYEREVIAERTQHSMRFLKAQGRTFGRKEVLSPERKVELVKAFVNGVPVSVLAKQFKVSRGTVRNYTKGAKVRRK